MAEHKHVVTSPLIAGPSIVRVNCSHRRIVLKNLAVFDWCLEAVPNEPTVPSQQGPPAEEKEESEVRHVG